MQTPCVNRQDVSYSLNAEGGFVIENYNHSKAFSNFFPGVAGLWGIPMWVFYANRGQCISSFGIEGKNKAILEFQPANKAYRLTALQGYRTFLKIRTGQKDFFWEPFQNNSSASVYKTQQKMLITAHDLTLEDVNVSLGLVLRVNYFTMPQESFPALVRRVTIENISSKHYDVEGIDGLPIILPYGLSDWAVKNMTRTAEAWVKVHCLEDKTPYVHLNVDLSDTSVVKHITEGNFYFGFDATAAEAKLLEPLVDASKVFGNSSDFRSPECFLQTKHYVVPLEQQTSNRTPCAMSFFKGSLLAKGKKEIVSLAGYAHSQAQLNKIVKRVTTKGFIAQKAQENKGLVDDVKNYAFTSSSSLEYNLHTEQAFLDNVLRGGLPLTLRTKEGETVFSVFSRKHGDPERDYNYFILAPTFFSQGNGNYRDVNQNRRNDVWFNPAVRDNSVVDFFNLSQADGYNPLVVKGTFFFVDEPQKIDPVLAACIKGGSDFLKEKLKKGFQPGELLTHVVQNGIHLKVSPQEFLERVLKICRKQTQAEHGEGFWSDHWTYNLDLIESFLGLYPEELRTLLLERKNFSFFHNGHYVLPRDERYLLTPQGVRQYHSVRNAADEIRAEEKGNKLRTRYGDGNVYYTTLVVKLLCLITNKAATLDPSGIGIEMEADKPNWYDALNGLPGLLGSSISETLELRRYCIFLSECFGQLKLADEEYISAFEELADFIAELKNVLTSEHDPFMYWQRANEIKEHYRSRIRKGIAGEEHGIKLRDLKDFLRLIIERTDKALKHAQDGHELFPTYFYHEVTHFKTLDQKYKNLSYVQPLKFKRHDLPLFLEGFVHALRIERDGRKALRLYRALRASPLFDKKLKMYKVNADLSGATEEIGRASVFPRGWLENESVWLHMEYKYLLELLRCGLHEEFLKTFKEVLVPFLKPEVYGRSILENSSFIVSSAHEDASLHGQGFVARLSGSTAEFLHIWLLMNTGARPFVWDHEQGLRLEFKPVLPGWLFTKKETRIGRLDGKKNGKAVTLPKNTYAFNFLGNILTVYHNSSRKNTFGEHGCWIKEIVLTYPGNIKPFKISGSVIPEIYARDIRGNRVERIDVYFE